MTAGLSEATDHYSRVNRTHDNGVKQRQAPWVSSKELTTAGLSEVTDHESRVNRAHDSWVKQSKHKHAAAVNIVTIGRCSPVDPRVRLWEQQPSLRVEKCQPHLGGGGARAVASRGGGGERWDTLQYYGSVCTCVNTLTMYSWRRSDE